MPKIEDFGGRIPLSNAVPNLAMERPSQAFAQLGGIARAATQKLEKHAEDMALLDAVQKVGEFDVETASREEKRKGAHGPLRTEDDLDTFMTGAAEDFDGRAQSLLDAVDSPAVASFLEERLLPRRSAYMQGATKYAAEVRVNEMMTAASALRDKAANLLLDHPEKFDALRSDHDAYVDAAGFAPAVAAKLKRDTAELYSYSTINGLIDRKPGQALQLLRSGRFDDVMDPKVKVASEHAAQAKLEEQVREARQAANAQAAVAASNLSVQINAFGNGQTGFTEADFAAGTKGLSTEASNRLRIAFDDARARRERDQGDVIDVAEAIRSGPGIDPGNAKQTKAFDTYFRNSVLPTIANDVAALPEGERAAAAEARTLNFVRDVGVVPPSMRADIRSRLRSGNDESVASAVAQFGQLRSMNPDLERDFVGADLELARSVLAQTETGVAPLDAVKRYREGKLVDDATRAVRLQQFKKELDADPSGAETALRSAVGGDASWMALLGGAWVSEASVPAEAVAQFDARRREEFVRTGNMEATTLFAAESVKRVYGVSELGGGRTVSKYAPEQLYGSSKLSVSENAAWIREQARTEFAEAMGSVPDGDVSLTPARRAGPDGKPAYVITITQPDGTIVTPQRNGRPLLFVPDFKATTAKKQLDADTKAGIDAVRADKRDQVEGFEKRSGTLPGDWGL